MFNTLKRLAVASGIALTLASPVMAQQGRGDEHRDNDRGRYGDRDHDRGWHRGHGRPDWGWYQYDHYRWMQRHCYYIDRWGQRVWVDCYNYYPDPYQPPPGRGSDFHLRIEIPFGHHRR
jgi:hypothetical protein